MKKGGGDMMVNWIWSLCSMAFESDVVPEGWRYTVIVPKKKEERTQCKIYKGIGMLCVE